MWNDASAMRRFISAPIELHWMGWKSDTATLARNGWDLAANQDVMDRSMQIAIRNNKYGDPIRGLSQMMDWDYYRHMMEGNFGGRVALGQISMAHQISLNCNNFAVDDWSAIDARPSYMEMNQDHRSFDKMMHFQKVHQDTKEIILQRATMDEVLQFALDKQQPRQEEIRKEMIKRKELEQYRQNSQPVAELRLAA